MNTPSELVTLPSPPSKKFVQACTEGYFSSAQGTKKPHFQPDASMTKYSAYFPRGKGHDERMVFLVVERDGRSRKR